MSAYDWDESEWEGEDTLQHKMNLNAVRGREDWFLGLVVRGPAEWEVAVYRHADRATFDFSMAAPFSFDEVHQEAVRQIEAWEAQRTS